MVGLLMSERGNISGTYNSSKVRVLPGIQTSGKHQEHIHAWAQWGEDWVFYKVLHTNQ